MTGGAPAQLPAEAATSEPTRIGAAHSSAAATRASVTASKEDNPATREETAEAAAAARGEAATGEEVPLQAGAAVATGEADEAGPEADRGPLRCPNIEKKSRNARYFLLLFTSFFSVILFCPLQLSQRIRVDPS